MPHAAVVLLLAPWLAVAAAFAAPAAFADSDPLLRNSMLEAIALYNANDAVGLPAPSPAELDELLDGQVVKYRLRTETTDFDGQPRQRFRIVGLRLVEQPRLLVWLAALDIGTSHAERLTEHLIASDTSGGSLWYQYLQLPWPLKDRHWVIRNFKRSALTAATNDAVWEHAWQLEDDGPEKALQLLRNGEVASLGLRDGEKALYLPVNRGGWTMIELASESTLVAVHVITELGGVIPDRLVASLVSKQLDSMLNGLVPRTTGIHERYDTRYPIFTGGAQIITREMASAAARH